MTAPRPDTWMPFYIGDYLADTMHLGSDEHGPYLLLIFAYWRNGGPLADDDAKLSKIARVTSKRWNELRPTLAEFFTVADGTWWHKRIERELEEAQRNVERNNARTAAASEARRNRNDQRNDERNDDESGNVTTNVTRTTARASSPSPSPKKEDTPSLASQARPPARSRSLSDPLLDRDFAEWYAQCPRKLGKGAALKAYRAARKKTDHATLMAGISRFSALCEGQDPKFIPHPATWLNAERWTDEPDPKPDHDELEIPAELRREPRRRNGTDAFLAAAASLATGMGGEPVAQPGDRVSQPALPGAGGDRGRNRAHPAVVDAVSERSNPDPAEPLAAALPDA